MENDDSIHSQLCPGEASSPDNSRCRISLPARNPWQSRISILRAWDDEAGGGIWRRLW